MLVPRPTVTSTMSKMLKPARQKLLRFQPLYRLQASSMVKMTRKTTLQMDQKEPAP